MKKRAPKGLKASGRAFWRKVRDEYVFTDAHDLARLLMAAKCLDDLQTAEEQVEQDGHFVKNRYGNIIEHPAVKSIKDFRLLFVKIVRELNLDVEAAKDARPPRLY